MNLLTEKEITFTCFIFIEQVDILYSEVKRSKETNSQHSPIRLNKLLEKENGLENTNMYSSESNGTQKALHTVSWSTKHLERNTTALRVYLHILSKWILWITQC